MRAAKVQASLRIRAVSPEPSLLAHTSSESRGTFSLKTRSIAFLNGCACAVKICHDGMLEDTNSLDGARMMYSISIGCTIVALGLANGAIKDCQISGSPDYLPSHPPSNGRISSGSGQLKFT